MVKKTAKKVTAKSADKLAQFTLTPSVLENYSKSGTPSGVKPAAAPVVVPVKPIPVAAKQVPLVPAKPAPKPVAAKPATPSKAVKAAKVVATPVPAPSAKQVKADAMRTIAKQAVAARAAAKDAKAAGAPDNPLTKALLRAGFVYKTSRLTDDGKEAFGYKHADGSAAVVVGSGDGSGLGTHWQLVRGTQPAVQGKSAAELAKALFTKNENTVPAPVQGALTMLRKLTKCTYSFADLKGEDGDALYTNCMRLLKVLRKTDKVPAKDCTISTVSKEFFAALKTDKAGFLQRCLDLYKQQGKQERAVKRAEIETVKTVRSLSGAKPILDGKPILPGKKKVSAKKQRELDAATAREIAARAAIQAEEAAKHPIAAPRPDAQVAVDLNYVSLLTDPANGIVLMVLEKPNSQGAICVYNNGSRVAAGVVSTEVLKTMRPQTSDDLVRDVNQLLHPLTAGVEVTHVAHCHLTAVLEALQGEMTMKNTTAVKSAKFAPPATAAKKSVAAKPSKAEKGTKVRTTSAANKAAKDKTPRAGGFAGKKIKVISKDMSALREGTKRYIGLAIILKAKTTDEAIPLLAKAGCDNSWFAFATGNGYVELT